MDEGKRLKFAGFNKLSVAISVILRGCGDVLGVLVGKSGHNVALGLMVLVELESNE